jgi:hypothetical protein
MGDEGWEMGKESGGARDALLNFDIMLSNQ